MRLETVNAKSRLYAILGDPISHSMSPVIMNSAFDRLGLDSVFLALPANLETVARVMEAMRLVDLKGYVFTMPVKEAVLPYMDALSDEAEMIGAVNCAVNEGGRLTGYNTDSTGFWTAVQEKNAGAVSIRKVFIMGAGGFARAAAAQAALQGVGEIVVANKFSHTAFLESFQRFRERLSARCPQTSVKLLDWDGAAWEAELADCQLIANATPNGMKNQGDLHSFFPYAAVSPAAIFFDAIYDPYHTRFLQAAEARGHKIVGGLDLLAHQGVCSFFNWTGLRVEPEQMREDVLAFWKAHGQG